MGLSSSEFPVDYRLDSCTWLCINTSLVLCETIKLRASSMVERHPSLVLEMVNHGIIRAIRSHLSVAVSIRTQDLLDILLFLSLFLLFPVDVGLLGKLVLIKHTFSDFFLHINKLFIHGDRVHAANNGLARHPIESDVVVRSVLILVVEE